MEANEGKEEEGGERGRCQKCVWSGEEVNKRKVEWEGGGENEEAGEREEEWEKEGKRKATEEGE